MLPPLGESQQAAHARFAAAVRQVAAQSAGCSLIVTHGDAVGALVEHLQPGSVVYEVHTMGFIHLQQGAEGKPLVMVGSVGVGMIE